MSENIDALVAFLKERYDEDKATANAGARRLGMPWRAEPQPGTPGGLVTDELGLVGSTGGRYAADHIARHDPARALREVAAGRMIIAMYENPGTYDVPGDVIVQLGTVFSDHPDYRPSFTPEGALNA